MARPVSMLLTRRRLRLPHLFAFRFSLSFARTQLARYRWFCVEASLLSLLVGVLIHSGKRFLSLSVFLSFLSLSTILIGFSFSRFLYVAGRSLSALGRLVAAPLSANTEMRAGSGLSVFLSPRLLPLLVWHEA